MALKPAHVMESRVRCIPEGRRNPFIGAGGGIRTPDLLITNQLLYRPELRQPDKGQIIARPVPAEQPFPLSSQI